MNTNSSTSSSVGPKPNRMLSMIDGPALGFWAVILTFSLVNNASNARLSPNDGICVEK